MANPSTQLTTQRPDLAESFMEFDLANAQNGFIATKLMPVMEVASQAGVFGKIPLDQLLQQRDTLRSPGSGYNRGSYTFTQDSYACIENGLEEILDDRESKMYANYFDAEVIASQRAFNGVLRSQEERVAALVQDPSTFNTTAVTNEWDDSANCSPLVDVEGAVQRIWDATGLRANCIAMSWKVYRNLRNSAEIIDRLQAAGAGQSAMASEIGPNQLAALFDVDMVLVGGGVKNGAAEGLTANPQGIWDDEYVAVTVAAKSQDMREPCFGRILHWGQDGSSIGGSVEQYRDETVRGSVLRVRHDVTEKVLYTPALELLSNITS